VFRRRSLGLDQRGPPLAALLLGGLPKRPSGCPKAREPLFNFQATQLGLAAETLALVSKAFGWPEQRKALRRKRRLSHCNRR